MILTISVTLTYINTIHLPYKNRMKVDSATFNTAFYNDKWETPQTIAGRVLLAVPSTSHLECNGSRCAPRHFIHHCSSHLCKLLLSLSPHAAGAFFPIPSPAFFSRAPLGAQIRPSRAPELRRWWGHTSFITHLTGFQIKHHSSVEDRSYFYVEMKTAPF